MMIEQIQRELAAAADDVPAPPTRVTVTEIYRAGLRRRRVRRWASVAAVTVAAAGVAGGVTGAVASVRPAGTTAAPMPTTDPGPYSEPVGSAPGQRAGSPAPGSWRSCAQLAAAVTAAARSALPADIRWGDAELPDGQAEAECGSGGIFWVSFTSHGQARRLAFEGGTGGSGSGCDPRRRPRTCESIDDGQVGHLSNEEEYGVLLSLDRDGVYFFLGIIGGPGEGGIGEGGSGTEQPLTTAQLSVAAQRIAADVFG